jgi:hypothetical protein
MKADLTRVYPDVKWESLEQTESGRLWGGSVQGCPGQPDQSELAQLARARAGFHVVHCAIKKAPMPDEKRSPPQLEKRNCIPAANDQSGPTLGRTTLSKPSTDKLRDRPPMVITFPNPPPTGTVQRSA